MATKKNSTPEIGGFEKKVDELKGIVSEIEDLKSKASVLESELKEEGASKISGFGSLNFLGSDVIAQIQKRRPSISANNGGVEKLEGLLGDKFPLLFEVETDSSAPWALRQDRVNELQTIISKAGKDVSDFITLNRTAKAKDTFLEEPVRLALLGKKAKDIFEKVLSFCNVKGSLDGVLALKWNAKK